MIISLHAVTRMRTISTLLFLFANTPVLASSKAPTLPEVINEAKSVFHGEVISGRIESKFFTFEGKELENRFGHYTVEVIKHIAGKRFHGNVRVTTEFAAVTVGPYHYPAPGLEYIFVVDTDREPLEFSPYHLPRVAWKQGIQLVVDVQHSFVEGVNF